jgi:hypothetical protein
MITVDQIDIAILERYPVMEFFYNANESDLSVVPVLRVPVTDMSNRMARASLIFSCGCKATGIIGNLDLTDPCKNAHFITLVLFDDDRKFVLARYHDINWKLNGPGALSRWFGKAVKDIFPIHYDVSEYCLGRRDAVTGFIYAEPKTRLSREELVALSLS